jgi:hypothetical protein
MMLQNESELVIEYWGSEPITAYNLKLNTFKVGKLISIPKSGLIVATLEDYGAMVLNMSTISKYNDP